MLWTSSFLVVVVEVQDVSGLKSKERRNCFKTSKQLCSLDHGIFIMMYGMRVRRNISKGEQPPAIAALGSKLFTCFCKKGHLGA